MFKTHNASVLVRVRPLLKFQNQPAWMIKQNSVVALQTHSRTRLSNESANPSKEVKDIQYEFNFESIVPEGETSEQLFKKQVKPTLLACCSSYSNLSIMAYGQTCSGKTHTILGVKDAPGIIPCVLRQLFKVSVQKTYRLKVSYLQIYNEKLRDLLDKKGADKQLKIAEDSRWGCDVVGASKQPINSFEQAIKLLERGEKERQYGQGEHHQRSSRSHTLFKIVYLRVSQFLEEWDSNFNCKSFSITIVDLAGSERLVSSSQSSTETGFINKSLFQLTNVISKLAEQSLHIPFRDSKLTRILQPSLSNSGRTILICCVSPSLNCYNETLSTLRLAERAKKIKLPDQPILDAGDGELQLLRQQVRQKNKECLELKKQIQVLSSRLANQQKEMERLKGQRGGLKKCDMVILFDHQNFLLFIEDELAELQVSAEVMAGIKEGFVQNMQQLYQSYTHEIVQLCGGDRFELKIEEVCFMNMVLEHQKITEYKLTVIGQLLRERQQKELADHEHFYQILQAYQKKLVRQVGEYSCISDQSRKNFSRNSVHSLVAGVTPLKQSLMSNEGKRIQVTSSQFLVWGSKKDYRVCRGQSYKLGMTKVISIKNITKVTCGYHHTLILTAEGKLFGWGKNTQKQLSSVNKQSIGTPMQLERIKQIKDVAAGWGHSLVVTQSGLAYSWGYGKDGQLGLGTRESSEYPSKIDHANKILSVFAGHSHSAFLDSFNDLFMFGFNQDYRLMIGDQKMVLEPRRVPIRDIKDASLGVSHSAVATLDGIVYCGGVGTYGELGVILNQNCSGWEKLQVADRQFQAEPFQKICPLVQVQLFGPNCRASKVGCGENSTFVLTQQKDLWSFGKSNGGRVGHKKRTPCKILQNIEQMGIGCRHGFALNREQNKLYSWGFNLYGQANPSISGDVQSPCLLQELPQRAVVGLGCGFLHSVVLLSE